MKLKQQVCSLELAKQLKELGVKQESLFYWQEINSKKPKLVQNRNTGNENSNDEAKWYSAFTVAELGEMLPVGAWVIVKTDGAGFRFTIPPNFIDEETEADARAKMLIYLLENKFI